jgi:hypothetical protein
MQGNTPSRGVAPKRYLSEFQRPPQRKKEKRPMIDEG